MNDSTKTKSITGDNVKLLSVQLRERISNRLGRLALIMEEAAASEIDACEKDDERPADFAVAYLAVFTREVQDIVEECGDLESLIKKLAS